MSCHKFHLTNSDALQQILQALTVCKLDGSFAVEIKKIANKRTYTQNNAIHKYLDMLALEFNNAGLTVQQVLAQAIEREWTMLGAKEQIWRPIQLALTNEQSSTQIKREQVSAIYDTINRHTGEKFGLYVPFPTKELRRTE